MRALATRQPKSTRLHAPLTRPVHRRKPWSMSLFRSSPARVLLLFVSLVPFSTAQQPDYPQSSRPANPHLPTLFLVGDTALRNSPGQPPLGSESLVELFDSSRINLVDRTIDHRTTRSYITGGDWQRTLALVKSGDFVLFQFAATDPGVSADTTAVPGTLPGIGDEIREVKDPARPEPEIVHTYGWYLRLYLVETIARGAIPILCSQPPAPTLPGQPAPSPDLNVDWARQIASQQRVAFLDLESAARALTANGEQTATAAPVGTSSPGVNSPARLEARSIIAALKGLPNDPLAGYLSSKAESIRPFHEVQESRDQSRRSPDMPDPSANARPATSF